MGRRAALVGVVCALAPAMPCAAGAQEITVVQANVGNVNVPGCAQHVYKLCLTAVEQRAAQSLRALRPDVVALQEILPEERCASTPSSNPFNVCSGARTPASQVERLLGEGVRHACDQRHGWDCLASPLLVGALSTRPIAPGCEDDGFTLSTGRLEVRGWPIDAIVAHPDSTDVECRAAQVRDALAALPPAGPALVLGDFNLDPYREADASVDAWNESVPARLQPLSGQDYTSFPGAPSQLDPTGLVTDPLGVTVGTGPLTPRSIDHVLARGLTGACHVRRVDGGGGMDHRAQVCRVTVPPDAAPSYSVVGRRCELRARMFPVPAHLTAVRFAARGRAVIDRRAPFRARIVTGGRRVTVTVTPLLANGEGPGVRRRIRGC